MYTNGGVCECCVICGVANSQEGMPQYLFFLLRCEPLAHLIELW